MPENGTCECSASECRCRRRSWAAHVPWLRLAGIAAGVAVVIAFLHAPAESRTFVNEVLPLQLVFGFLAGGASGSLGGYGVAKRKPPTG